jgi:DNA-binding response OmpR family regulator
MFGSAGSTGFILCVGITLQEVTEIARLLRDRAVVLVASDVSAARTMLAPAGGAPHHAVQAVQAVHAVQADPGGVEPDDPTAAARAPISAGSLVVDPVGREATLGGHTIHLSPREFDLLALLASDVGRAWTFADLSERVWGNRFLGDKEQLASTVKRLRKRLSTHRGCEIRSVPGIGYRLRIVPA